MKFIHLLFFILFILLFSSCGILRNMMTEDTFEPVQSDSGTFHYAPIYWHIDSLGGEKPEKTSVFIPVTVNGISENLYMQFDLGATMTGFYEIALNALKEKYPRIDKNINETDNYMYFADAFLGINDYTTLKAKKLYVWKGLGQEKLDTTVVKLHRNGKQYNSVILGTMGYDIIGDRVLILDFKKNRYALAPGIPKKLMNKIQFIEGADLDKFPILLPFQYGNKKITLIYDTGAGNSPIMTGTNRLKRLTKTRPLKKIDEVSRFGEKNNMYKVADTKSIRLNGFDYGRVDAYGLKVFNKLWFAGIYGLTGNYFFKDCIVIVDRKNNRFGVIR